jgi:hypothetical protein
VAAWKRGAGDFLSLDGRWWGDAAAAVRDLVSLCKKALVADADVVCVWYL